jgi:hypothetical protein
VKRNLDTIREILLKIEASDIPLDVAQLTSDPQKYRTMSFHVKLLMDAGYIECDRLCAPRAYDNYDVERLTNAGCDYLDTIRNDKIWSQVKDKIETVGGSAALETVKQVAIDLMKNLLGI